MKPAKSRYTFIIYTTPSRTPCTGILGTFELCTVQFLLAGGKYLIEEEYDGKDPVKWYTDTLKEQDIFVTSSKQQKYKGQNYIWLEIDPEKTPVHEFASWKDIDAKDMDTLAWRKVLYPCNSGTTKECLGLAVVAREICLTKKGDSPLYLANVLDAILYPDPKEL
jgi:hypothetical protein